PVAAPESQFESWVRFDPHDRQPQTAALASARLGHAEAVVRLMPMRYSERAGRVGPLGRGMLCGLAGRGQSMLRTTRCGDLLSSARKRRKHYRDKSDERQHGTCGMREFPLLSRRLEWFRGNRPESGRDVDRIRERPASTSRAKAVGAVTIETMAFG